MAEISIDDLRLVSLTSWLKIIPLKVISSKIAGINAIETIESNNGAGE